MKQRDSILLPYLFSDRSKTKIRPAVIVSDDICNEGDDVIVCAITSNIQKRRHSVMLEKQDLEEESLERV